MPHSTKPLLTVVSPECPYLTFSYFIVVINDLFGELQLFCSMFANDIMTEVKTKYFEIIQPDHLRAVD